MVFTYQFCQNDLKLSLARQLSNDDLSHTLGVECGNDLRHSFGWSPVRVK